MRKIISMMIALLCMVVKTAWAEWEGSRTQANPYQISSVADRNTLATNVEAGNTPPDLSSIKQSEIFSVTISVVTEKNVLALIDGADNTDMIEKYDGQIAEVTYDREFSAIDNGDGTWTPRCYTICLPYDFNLYDQVKSGQASLYRLKYVDGEKGHFIFTNDFGFASAGMGWLLVVNQGSISLNVAAATITAQTKSEEVYGYQGPGIRPSIRTIETDGTSRYFDLHGRHIGKKPVSGVYIHDGKKFVNTPRRLPPIGPQTLSPTVPTGSWAERLLSLPHHQLRPRRADN